jgi:hypothetical protein
MDPENKLTPALGEARKRRQTLHDAIVQLEMAISSPAAGRAPDWATQVTKAVVGVRDAGAPLRARNAGSTGARAGRRFHDPRVFHADTDVTHDSCIFLGAYT